jgi:hypothetical protein
MLNNVVNFVKYGVFILLVVVMFFKKNSGYYLLLWFETILNKECINLNVMCILCNWFVTIQIHLVAIE